MKRATRTRPLHRKQVARFGCAIGLGVAVVLAAQPASSTIIDIGDVFVLDGALVVGGTATGTRVNTGSPDGPYAGFVVGFGFSGASLTAPLPALSAPGVLSAPVTGALKLQGAGAVLSIAGTTGLQQTVVGYNGSGSLDISAGGVLSASGPSVGVIALGGPPSIPPVPSTGNVTVTGAGSQWTIGSLRVGHQATGSLTIADGAVVNTTGNTPPGWVTPSILGTFSGAAGTITVTGAGSTLKIVDRLGVADGNPTRGNFGPATGLLSILNGGLVTSAGAAVGNFGPARAAESAIGTATVSGLGSRWELSGPAPLGFARIPLEIGRSGIGTLNVRDGASVVIDGTPGGTPGAVLTAGLQVGSNGTISVSGPGSRIEVRGPSNTSRTELMDGVPVTFGVTGNIGFNGTGRLEVLGGGQVVIGGTDVSTGERAGFLNVGRNPGSTGTALVSGTGSELNVASTVRLGGPSNPSGGQNEPGGTGVLTVLNAGVVRSGQVQVGAGSTLNGNGTIIGDVVNLGGVVSPGSSSPGTLTVRGNYLQEAGLLHLDVASTGHDLLRVTGALAIDPLDSIIRILLDPSLSAAPGTLFELVRSGSGDILSLAVFGDEFAPRGTGIFAGLLAEHPVVVQLQPVPEPSTFILLGSGVAALAGLAKRRYRRK